MIIVTSTRPGCTLVIAGGLLLSGTGAAQNTPPHDGPELAAYCADAPCRRDVVSRVRLADGRIQEESKPLHRPAITRDSVSVLLGEEIRAVPEFDDATFRGWRPAERREGGRTTVMTIKIEQIEDGSIAAQIANSGRDPIKLRLYLRTPGAIEGDYTSSCPVVAGGSVYEYWSQPVIEVIVRDAILVTDDSALLCD